ncbi:MAG: hypothetical protein AABY14_01580 [Nanoarchaeota archaeon]|jgi:DNA replication initiation complex subunit (GINS family)
MEEDKNIITYELLFELLRKERSSDALQKLNDGFYSNVLSYIKDKDTNEIDIISNVKRMIKEIYERREKKIILLAVDKCRLGMESLNTANILNEEREIYDKTLEILLSSRSSLLESVLRGSLQESEPKPKPKEEQVNNTIHPKGITMVRFLNAVPRFVGKELEIYGPYEPEDISVIPTEIAKLLISKARAEEINENKH